jgi:hypothetical protein
LIHLCFVGVNVYFLYLFLFTHTGVLRQVGGRLWVLKSINNWNIVDSGVVYHTPLCWCLARYQNQMMFGSYTPRLSLLFQSTLFRPCFIWIRCSVLSLVVFLFFFVFFFFYFWPLFFFWYLIYGFWKLTSLVSSTFYN